MLLLPPLRLAGARICNPGGAVWAGGAAPATANHVSPGQKPYNPAVRNRIDRMLKIISGAQTGVDRAALDVALKRNVPCGGWCPKGRKAEDGTIPEVYPVRELVAAGYAERTKKNVQDSDGTVIIYFGRLSGGTEETLRCCLDEKKPYLLLDGLEVTAGRAAERITEFQRMLPAGTLNFAGPRASVEPRAYDYTTRAVEKFLQLHGNGGC